jgi:hypothetical protein
MKEIRLTESELISLIRKSINENQELKQDSSKKVQNKPKPRCVPENVISLDEIMGNPDDFQRYAPGISKRNSGVWHLVDTLGALNNIRLLRDVKDGGSHLSYDMMHHLNKFRNKNYYDETTGQCNQAMDKIIELYKENEHGTDLVKDIQKILDLQTKDDEFTPSPRAKEYLKQCINLVKGK